MHIIMKGTGFYIRLLPIIGYLACFACTKKYTASNSLPGSIDTMQAALFQKYSGNPVFNTGTTAPGWRNIHVANTSILTPAQTQDGKWRLFMRGSANNADGYHDNIGTLEQPATGFDPLGPWNEIAGNPNLRHGAAAGYDAQNVLDAAATVGPGKIVYLCYMGRDANNRSSLNEASSVDGGLTFTKFAGNPLKYDVGPNDILYADSSYYLFYGDAKYNGSGFDEPLQIWVSKSPDPAIVSSAASYALKVGGFGSFDSYSVNGAKIFKVIGDKRYFMLYQCSTKNFDYPERFHCAWSYDLVSWTKVSNTRPLLTRGDPGEFDQGAIWTGAVFENNGVLYIYYEGWGSFNNDAAKRDNVYYGGGNSRVGAASCPVADFLNWAK